MWYLPSSEIALLVLESVQTIHCTKGWQPCEEHCCIPMSDGRLTTTTMIAAEIEVTLERIVRLHRTIEWPVGHQIWPMLYRHLDRNRFVTAPLQLRAALVSFWLKIRPETVLLKPKQNIANEGVRYHENFSASWTGYSGNRLLLSSQLLVSAVTAFSGKKLPKFLTEAQKKTKKKCELKSSYLIE